MPNTPEKAMSENRKRSYGEIWTVNKQKNQDAAKRSRMRMENQDYMKPEMDDYSETESCNSASSDIVLETDVIAGLSDERHTDTATTETASSLEIVTDSEESEEQDETQDRAK